MFHDLVKYDCWFTNLGKSISTPAEKAEAEQMYWKYMRAVRLQFKQGTSNTYRNNKGEKLVG